MNIWKFIFICALTIMVFFPNLQQVKAQESECPRIGPCDNLPPIEPPRGTIPAVPAPTPASLTFADYMQELTLYAVAMRQSFIQTVEGTLGGYFLALAYWLAFIVFLTYFLKSAYHGAWTFSEIGKHTLTFALCLMLLGFCGDPNGDGVNGDLVNTFSDAGNAIAYGSTSGNSYIGELVEYEQDTFDLNYKNFVDNKFMVRVNGVDMPVKYPGEESVTVLSAIYTGKPIDNPDLKAKAETTEWQMGALFQLLNVGRGFLQFVDFFLLWLNGFLILTARLIAPFMVAVAIDPDLRKRMSLNFGWSLLVVTVIFPVLTQIFRYLGYAAGNLGLGVNPTEPYFSWDATTSTLVANGEPQIIILIAAMLMFFAGFLLLFSFGIAFKLMQGQILEGIGSGISAAFTTLTSIGFGAAVTGYATRIQTRAEVDQHGETYRGAVVTADANNQAATVSANTAQQVAVISAASAYDAKITEAIAKNVAAKQGAFGTAVSGLINVQAEQYQAVNSAFADYLQNRGNMSLDEKKEKAMNFVEMLSKNDDATSKRIAEVIRQEPEKLDLLAEQYENILKGVPLGGSVASAFGLNKDGFNSWMRTEGFKATGQWLFGNPETGQGGMFNYGKATSEMFKQNKQLGGSFYGNTGGALVYNRPDGTTVDALTGQRLSNNVIDMTNPNNPVDSSGGTTVGKIFTGSNGNFRPVRSITNNRVARVMNDEMIKLGYTPNARLSMLGDIGRENNWNMNTIFAGHSDPANGAKNLGIISWQKDRRENLMNHLAKDGFVKNGQVIQSDGALRSMTRFMDKEMKTGKWGNQWAAMRNPNLSTQQVSDKLQKYILYSEDSKYNTLESGFNVANNRRWAEKAYGLVSATAGAGLTVKPTRNGGNKMVGNGGNGSQINGVSNNPSVPPQVSPLGSDKYLDANKMLGQIRKVDPPTAKVLSKQYAADYELESSYRNSRANMDGKNEAVQLYYQGKQQVNEDYKDAKIGIANNVASRKTKGVQVLYDSSVAAADTSFKGESDAAGIIRTGSLQSAGVQYQGSMNVADINYQREIKVADITKNAAIKASYERALGNAISNVGGNVVNQFSQAIEKFNRF